MMPHLGFYHMAFADPPDNIKLGYSEYEDNLRTDEYLHFLDQVLRRMIMSAPIVWISFNARWTLPMGSIATTLVKETGLEVKPCVQTFSFGLQMQHDLKNCHRPLWRFMRPGTPLYPDQAREPSWRLMNGDGRADPRGAVPSDVFDFPRVTGNSKQRRRYHPTQLHEGILERCVKLCTPPDGKVLDPFAGTGTTLRVCKRLGRQCTLIELDSFYCSEIAKEHDLTVKEDYA